MKIDALRELCLSFPGTEEQIQWGDALLFKVAGKMFAITSLEPSPVWLTLKAAPEQFAELTERPGIIPAPYLARAKWIALETPEAVSAHELEELVRASYGLVVERLPASRRPGAKKVEKKAKKSKARTRKAVGRR